ncbi:MAG: alpha/beta hydrolase [Acidimicrobiales bacterium]
MTVGYALTALLLTAVLVLGAQPLGRSGWRGRLSWLGGLVTAEVPFLPLALLALSTGFAIAEGDLSGAGWWVAGPALAAATAATAVITARSLQARQAVLRTFDAELGTGAEGRQAWDTAEARLRQRLRWERILLAPLPLTVPPTVKRTTDVSYGPDGRWHRLDVYRHRRRPLAGPVLVHLHGGGFTGGRKSFEARPLLHRLARHGWLCVSADYRRLPLTSYAGVVDDVQRALNWTRRHAAQVGADPDLVFVAGSSAGAHLALSAALGEPDDAASEPVAGVIGLYGYYGAAAIGGGVPPVAAAGPVTERSVGGGRAFPVLIAHGSHDTFVSPANARAAVDRLRRATAGPVAHVELSGAQHSFDLFHSIRFEILVNGIEAFAHWVLAMRATDPPS